MTLLIAFWCSIGVAAFVAALTSNPCLLGHKKPRSRFGLVCPRCERIVLTKRKR